MKKLTIVEWRKQACEFIGFLNEDVNFSLTDNCLRIWDNIIPSKIEFFREDFIVNEDGIQFLGKIDLVDMIK